MRKQRSSDPPAGAGDAFTACDDDWVPMATAIGAPTPRATRCHHMGHQA